MTQRGFVLLMILSSCSGGNEVPDAGSPDALVIGPPAATHSTLTQSADQARSDGTSTVTFVVALRDDGDHAVAGAAVAVSIDGQGDTLAVAQANAAGSTVTSTSVTGTTAADGTFTFTVASTTTETQYVSVTAGAVTLSAHVRFTGAWLSVNGPMGGAASAVAIDGATNPPTIYSGSGDGVFRSRDGGASFEPLPDGLGNDPAVAALVVDRTTTPSTIYAGTPNGDVFRLGGTGRRWTRVGSSLGGLYGRTVTALAIDPSTTPSTIIAGLAYNAAKMRTDAADWTLLNDASIGKYPYVLSLAVDTSTTPATIYAATETGVFAIPDDASTIWTSVSAGLPASTEVTALVIDTTVSPAVLHAAVYGVGIYASPLPVASHGFAAEGTGLPTFPAWATFAVDARTAPGTVYAAIAGGPGSNGPFSTALYRLNGSTWTPTTHAAPSSGIAALALDGTGRLFAAAGLAGVQRFDLADTSDWVALGKDSLPVTYVTAMAIDTTTTPATLFVASYAQLFWSRDGGTTWTELQAGGLGLDIINGLAIDPSTSPATIYAYSDMRSPAVFQLSADRTTWRSLSSGLGVADDAVVLQLLVVVTAGKATLYAATNSFGTHKADYIYKLDPAAVSPTWSQLTPTPPATERAVAALAWDPTPSAPTLYEASNAMNVYAFTSTWTSLGSLPRQSTAIAVDPATRELLAATYGQGLWRWTTTAPTPAWIHVDGPTGLTSTLGFWSAVLDPRPSPAVLYAGTGNGTGVFAVPVGGTTSVARGAGLPASFRSNINHLVVDPSTTPSTIYAGTNSNGVFKTVTSGQ